MNSAQQHIVNMILDRLESGALPVNGRLETEQELSKRFHTGRMDVHFAVKFLERQALVRRNKRSGTHISRRPTAFEIGLLKGVGTKQVCVLNTCLPKFRHIHWNTKISTRLEAYLRERGFGLNYQDFSGKNTRTRLEAGLRALAREGVNALVIIPGHRSNPLIVNADLLFQYHQNVFLFDRGLGNNFDWPFHTVAVNLFEEGCLAARRLVGNNFQKIAFCHDQCLINFWAQERWRGVQFGLKRFSEGTLAAELWGAAVRPLDKIHAKLRAAGSPVALIAQNDEFAARLISFLRTKGLTVGKDYSLLSFDDNNKYQDYNLTTVAPALEAIADCLGELICRQVDAATGEIHHIKIASRLIERATCKSQPEGSHA